MTVHTRVSCTALIVTCIMQKIRFDKVLIAFVGGLSLIVALIIWGFSQLPTVKIGPVSTSAANIILFVVIIGFIVSGIKAKINVYEAFVEGAKDGFTTAVKIIPYLIAILVGIGVFRASGAMDALVGGIGWCAEKCGLDSQFVGALPTALMKPLSGGGARGLMIDAMTTYGADSFTGRLACLFQGSTDTTFYILAVFIHEEYVQKWLDLIRGAYIENIVSELKLGVEKPPMPYSDSRLLSYLQHTYWFLPSVAACKAMAGLLNKRYNRFYSEYKVIVAAGNEAGMGADAVGPVYNAMEDPQKSKTITLSCGKLSTGVTVKPWTGILMLRNTTSPETYVLLIGAW